MKKTATTTTWKININLWEEQYLNDRLQPIFDRVADEIDEMIGSEPILGYKPIELHLDFFHGPTLYWPLKKDYYKLGLHIDEQDYAKAVMQFAHVITHLYVDPRVNNWFIESICQLMGYYFIDKFVSQYNGYEIPVGFDDSSVSFSDFYNEQIRKLYSEIDLVQHQHSANWIKREVKNLSCDEKWDTVVKDMVALEILPVFKEQAACWQMIPYIGKSTSPAPPIDKANLWSSNRVCPDFDKLKSIVPLELNVYVKEILQRIWD